MRYYLCKGSISFFEGIVPQVVDVLDERMPKGRALVVLDAVLLADSLDVRRQLVQVAVVHAGEEMVLGLHV